MDYKTLIIAAIIIGALVFFYRELTIFKDEMRRRTTELSNSIDDIRDEIIQEVKVNFDRNLEKIRTVNNECIQQVRKMNMIQNQPVIKTSSHFTEVDSDGDIDVDYLSDQPKIPDILKKNDNSPYMSKDDSPISDNKNVISALLANTMTPKDTADLSQNITATPVVNKIENNVSNQPVVDDNTNVVTPKPEIITNIAKEIDIENDQDSEKNIIDDIVVEKDSDDNIQETSKFNINSIDNIMNEKIIVDLKNVEQPKDQDYDNITIGSKKDTVKKSLVKTNEIVNDDVVVDDDNQSIETGIIKDINVNTIKSVDNYNITALKKMAKCFGVSLSVKIDGKWKQLNKNDLYTKIKEYLSEKTK